MCRDCGCGGDHDHDHDHDHQHEHHHHHHHEGGRRRVALEADLLARNDRLASRLRDRLARERIAAFNLIGAPGAGKTALLESTIPQLSAARVAVIEGDQATDHDARRIAATGAEVVQVNTGPGCHLDATMIERGLAALDPPPGSLLFIENVGNLVCPALFDLGERAKIAVMSVTEGEEKPLKYPHVIQAAVALVLTKADLLPHLDIDPARFVENARQVNPAIEVFPLSARRGEGIAEWCRWLAAHMDGAR
jgi:hydrogenase nickel incorporation protein HypB